MSIWPAGLPQKPLIQNYGEVGPSSIVETNMAVGPPKTRARATIGVREYNVSYLMSTAQLATFETFYNTTIVQGSLAFEWSDALRSVTETEAVMSGKYSIEPRGPENYIVSFVIKVITNAA